jgi:DNA-binding transcriptional LysR family regulator
MELRHLRYFVATAETLNFSRAAARLHLTQPALSRQIRDLEHEIDAALFLRHGRSTALTAAGARLLPRAREILELAQRAALEAREAGRTLRLGHYGALWVDLFAPALRAFAKRMRSVTVELCELTPVEAVAALRRGALDGALVGPADDEVRREFAVRSLGTLSAVIVLGAANPLAKRRRLALSDLHGAGWLTWDESQFPGRLAQLHAAARDAGFEPRIAGTVDGIAAMFHRVSTSDAVGYAPPMVKKLPHTGVVFAELKPPGIAAEMCVVWRRNNARAAELTVLADLLASTLRTP